MESILGDALLVRLDEFTRQGTIASTKKLFAFFAPAGSDSARKSVSPGEMTCCCIFSGQLFAQGVYILGGFGLVVLQCGMLQTLSNCYHGIISFCCI